MRGKSRSEVGLLALPLRRCSHTAGGHSNNNKMVMINDRDLCVCVDTATLGVECYGHLYFSEEKTGFGGSGGRE